MKIKKIRVLLILIMSSMILAQGDFNLVDLNPNSITYGDSIGPSDYLDEICIIFFGHEY
jgi:hypothetical protein|tara:strand:- start:5520 stop:5696 length:177 start_codon:yes stop_codon:yes gene_type:complete